MEECKGCIYKNLNPLKSCSVFDDPEFTQICVCSTCLIKVNCTRICLERAKIFYDYITQKQKKI